MGTNFLLEIKIEDHGCHYHAEYDRMFVSEHVVKAVDEVLESTFFANLPNFIVLFCALEPKWSNLSLSYIFMFVCKREYIKAADELSESLSA